jgi:uncharacterized RDD family membrane protein YckC
MSEWYFVRDGERVGPRAREELVDLFAEDAIPADTLVWAPGMEAWTPAIDTREFAYLRTPQPPIPYRPRVVEPRDDAAEAPVLAPAARPSAGLHPWRRWFARFLDMMLFGIVFALVTESVSPGTLLSLEPVVVSLFLFLGWQPAEAMLISLTASTPAKRLMGIRVTRADGSRLAFGAALQRSLRVWIFGMGLGLPIVFIVAQVLAYMRLSGTGATSWDEALEVRVSHAELSPARWAVIAVLGAAFAAMVMLGALQAAGGAV